MKKRYTSLAWCYTTDMVRPYSLHKPSDRVRTHNMLQEGMNGVELDFVIDSKQREGGILVSNGTVKAKKAPKAV